MAVNQTSLYRHVWPNSLQGQGGCPDNCIEFRLVGDTVHCEFDQLWDANEQEWDRGSTWFPLQEFLDFLLRYFQDHTAILEGAHGHRICLSSNGKCTTFAYHGSDGLVMDIPLIPRSILEQLQLPSSAA